MKVRRTETRRLPDDERSRLQTLINAVPNDACATDTSVVELVAFYRTLKKPYWAPATAADYRIRLGVPLANVLEQLQALVHCEDWGDTPMFQLEGDAEH